jgi:hypothetical protein
MAEPFVGVAKSSAGVVEPSAGVAESSAGVAESSAGVAERFIHAFPRLVGLSDFHCHASVLNRLIAKRGCCNSHFGATNASNAGWARRTHREP